MTIRNASPAFVNAVRSLVAEGIALGKTDENPDARTAAAALEQNGYVDVHVGKTVEERLTIKQVRAIQAVHENRLDDLSPDCRKLLTNMRTLEQHRQHFVYYSGQSNTMGGFHPTGEYHAYYQTSVPLPLAMAQIDGGFPYHEGSWGFQPALGVVSAGEADGSVNKYVSPAWLTHDGVATLANTFTMEDGK